MAGRVDLGQLLDQRVDLTLQCIDRMYLNGYVPGLQVGGQVVNFLCAHRGNPIPSPALLGQQTKRFVAAVEAFARANDVAMIRVPRGTRKEDAVAPYVRRLQREGRDGVAVIVVAQEKSTSFRGSKLDGPGPLRFAFHRTSVYVKVYYFYLVDALFGPAFIKVSTYFPHPVRVCINGHEWLKRRLQRAGVDWRPLDNGLAWCADPAFAQREADRLTAVKINTFFHRWVARLPWSFTRSDRDAGYRHDLSVLQFEYALTAVFDRPLTARRFFEAMVRDNLDVGPPEQVAIIFDRRVTRATPGRFVTRLVDRDGVVTMSVPYKRSCRVKTYLKERRALRVETVINDTTEIGVNKRVENLPELVTHARSINQRMLDVLRVSQQCIPVTDAFEQVCLPSTIEGHKAPGLRFGDPLVLGLLGALTLFVHVPDGLTNASLRKAVTDRTGIVRTSPQASYDLGRLQANGLIERIDGTFRYQVTDLGRAMAVLYTRTLERVIAPAEHATTGAHDCPLPLARAWQALDRAFDQLIAQAGLQPAA